MLSADTPAPLHGRSGDRLTQISPCPCRLYSAWLMALSRQSFFLTGRTQVQNSSNFTGAASLPATICPVVSSTV
jgi:hypothetical protein